MTLWQVTCNDTQMRFYWFARKAEAVAHKREYDKEQREHLAKDKYNSMGECTIEAVEFKPGREGMAEALNWVITMTCFNEG